MIKKHCYLPAFATKAYLVFTLCVLCGLWVRTHAQDFKQLHPGVEYAEVQHKIGEEPVKINLLRLDLKKVRLDVHHALDKAIGLETTSSIAQRKGAVAAINAGFFRLDTSEFAGDAAGILQIDGNLWSESANERIAIEIMNGPDQTKVDFRHLHTNITVSYFSDVIQALSGINRHRRPDEIIAYTPAFGSTTRSDALGTEISFSDCKGHCKVEVREKSGNSPISKDGFVLSIGPERLINEKFLIDFMRSEMSGDGKTWAHLNLAPRDPTGRIVNKAQTEDITNGVPQLIKDGKIDITWEQEKASRAFVFNRHPRTAVAKLKDGKFLMMTVDGRQPGVSVGMTLQELAEYLFSLGAVDAMNLDGGGSTTMYLDGKVVNKPSDPTGERKIGDAITVTLRKPE